MKTRMIYSDIIPKVFDLVQKELLHRNKDDKDLKVLKKVEERIVKKDRRK